MKEYVLPLFVLFLALVFPKTVLAKGSVCITCHEGLEQTKVIVEQYRKSVHFSNGISCHNCHGGNPDNEDTAMDPDSGFVGAPDDAGVPPFCGKCHAGVLENYLKSAHGRLVGKGGPNCVTCHTAHEQQKASIALINEKLCGSCHTFERAAKIRAAMETTERKLEQADRQTESLWARGFDVDSIRKRIFADRNAFHRQTHVIEVDQIVKAATEAQSDLGKVESEIGKYQRIAAWREKIGAGIVLLFLIAAASFYFLKRDMVEEYLGKKYGKS